MQASTKPQGIRSPLRIDQANVFYNYTIGLESRHIDLAKTGAKLLKLGIARAVFFSDFKFLYANTEGKIQLGWIHPQGRRWDPRWQIRLGQEVPLSAARELVLATEVSFHEHRIAGPITIFPPYLRASLPPIVLESDNLVQPVFASIKIFDDGIAILTFQLDAAWDGLDEHHFISDIVNLAKHYCKSIWMDSRIQRLDAEILMPVAFQEHLSFAGVPLNSPRMRQLLRRMRGQSRQLLEKSLDEQGKLFNIADEEWTLHTVAGSKDQDSWESTMDLCRSEYSNALCALVAIRGDERDSKTSPS